MTLEHFVLPFTKSYIADGDIPPLRQASQILIAFFLHISCTLVTIASFNFIIVFSPIMEFHNYYMMNSNFILVEFHDIDIFIIMKYNMNIGVPRKE